MTRDRDVTAFDRRAAGYDSGQLGRWHRQIVERVADMIRSLNPPPGSILDVGCGTGQLLALLAHSLPPETELVGVDPAPGMLTAAVAASRPRERVRFEQARAESLPFSDGAFGLVVSTVSFDHWSDQRAGLLECRRVLRPRGTLVLADLLAPWLGVTTLARSRARTPRRLMRLLTEAGLEPKSLRCVMRLGPLPLIGAVIAESPERRP
jgi:ubiquinone/menaquinone biosynthesis C-methylase UbiE